MEADTILGIMTYYDVVQHGTTFCAMPTQYQHYMLQCFYFWNDKKCDMCCVKCDFYVAKNATFFC